MGDFPFVNAGGKRVMSLLAPNGTQTILAIPFPSSLSSIPLSIHRGGAAGPHMAEATFHSWSTEKVDVTIGPLRYRFRKRLDSQTGLGKLTWGNRKGEFFLREGTSEDSGVLVAQFVPRTTSTFGTSKVEGTFQIRKPGLSAAQFEEVVITGIFEMERRRRKAEGYAFNLATFTAL
ncbi:hypothetical protein B0T22DRAFT_460791 [Podospora appendiculata]|uniref:Uncharacterized protein n=1 Tax=Podospora appendiculata TaxID=314037 RepID=A0AAE1CCZ1_9PEZI|nr:hypothetical protein B0T22DRAFT_460791 [Podospora appendiculata]